jgi:hypothetical protein
MTDGKKASNTEEGLDIPLFQNIPGTEGHGRESFVLHDHIQMDQTDRGNIHIAG